MKYDLEAFLRDLEAVFKANLNTEIGLLNTEKGDFTLDTIHANAWYMNQIPRVWSYSPFIVWGISASPETTDRQEGNRIRRVGTFFEVVVPESQNTNESLFWKLLRYSRALEEVAIKNSDKFRSYAKLQVDQSMPVTFSIEGISKPLRSCGITVQAVLNTN